MRLSRHSLGLVSPSSPSVLSLVAAIQQQEGYYPGSLSYQNNNPGNLIYVGQPGATQGAGGFAAYPTYQAGVNAEAQQIATILNRGTCATGTQVSTLNDLIAGCLTPASRNPNVSAYVAGVSASTGIDPNADLASALGGDNAVSGAGNAVSAADAGAGMGIDATALAVLAGAGLLAWWILS